MFDRNLSCNKVRDTELDPRRQPDLEIERQIYRETQYIDESSMN